MTVEMPELGVRLFSECCALEQVGTIMDGACHLAIGAALDCMPLKNVPG